jgi:acetyltransferase-like isoleucine patch superfamily enzyme
MGVSLRNAAKALIAPFRKRGGVTNLASAYPQYEIGRGSYGDLKVLEFGEGAKLIMGAYCSVARGAQVFLGGEHRMDWVTTFPFSALDKRFAGIKGHPKTRGDVVIGNDVWLGRECMVMSGVTIGDGAVVGARAVVTRDVPPYGIVAGNPATLVRHRFAPEIVERLLAVAWWSWPPERVDAAVPRLLNGDVEGFLKAAESGEC